MNGLKTYEYGGYELVYDTDEGSITLYELHPRAKNPEKQKVYKGLVTLRETKFMRKDVPPEIIDHAREIIIKDLMQP